MVDYEKKWGAKLEPAQVVFHMTTCRVEGEMFRMPGMRISDAINQVTNFIALKDATVYALDSDKPLLSKPFVAIQKQHIVLVTEPE